MLMDMIDASSLRGAHRMEPMHQIVRPEEAWLRRPHQQPQDSGGNRPPHRMMALRWTGCGGAGREETATVEADCYWVGITLRPIEVTVFAEQKLIHEGRLQPGMMRIIEPGLSVRSIFRGAYDGLHLCIPQALVTEYLDGGLGGPRAKMAGPLSAQCLTLDTVTERLAHALIRADDFGHAFGQCYADGISLAILARLLDRRSRGEVSAGAPRVTALPKWRLKRATEYMAAHLGEPIGLADIAASAGLTRMHFAAQFRVATGLRPHEYLVRRRIERAQELLGGTRLSLAEIALDVGFKAQAHFTTVFTRIVGVTPGVWRRHNHASPPVPQRLAS